MKKILVFGIIIFLFYTLTGCDRKQIEVGNNEQHIIIHTEDRTTIKKYYTIDSLSNIIKMDQNLIKEKNNEELLEILEKSKTNQKFSFSKIELVNDGYIVSYEYEETRWGCNEYDVGNFITIGSENDCVKVKYRLAFGDRWYTNIFYNKDSNETFDYNNYIGNKVFEYEPSYTGNLNKTYITVPGKILVIGIFGTGNDDYTREEIINTTLSKINYNTIQVYNNDERHIKILILFE